MLYESIQCFYDNNKFLYIYEQYIRASVINDKNIHPMTQPQEKWNQNLYREQYAARVA